MLIQRKVPVCAETGASDIPCSETYAGSEAFSEIEMQVVRDQLLPISPRVYLTFHSYSQLWMYPWGYTFDLPDNWQDLVGVKLISFQMVFGFQSYLICRCTIASKINVTRICAYLPISKLQSILSASNLLANNNKSQICYCG